MARQVVVDVVGDASKFSKATNDAVNGAGRMDKGFRGAAVGGAVAGAAMGVVTKAIDFVTGSISTSIDAASALNETVNKTSVVFGSASKGVLDWGNNAINTIGLAANTALSAASTYGNLFVALGITGDKAAGMSEKMVELAVDLHSFNDVPTADALAAIQSGLVGETEPLRKFGVNLNDATLRQKALAMGLTTTTTGVLPPAIKAQAAYALILDQTKTAQGDYARTSGSVANQQGKLTEQALAGSAAFGQRLLPAVMAAQRVFADYLIPALLLVADILGNTVGAAVGFVSDNFIVVGPAIAGVATIIAINLIPAAIGAAASLWAMIAPVLVAAAPFIAVGVAIAAVIVVAQKLIEIGSAVVDFIGSIPGPWHHAEEATDKAAAAFNRAGEAMSGMEQHAGKMADDIVQPTKTTAKAIETVGAAATTSDVKVKTAFEDIVTAITNARSRIHDAAQASADAIHDPIIAGLAIVKTKQDIAAQDAIISSKKSTAGQVLDAKLRRQDLLKTLDVQLADQTTYGDAATRLAAINAQIARVKSTAEWTKGTAEQKSALQAQVANLEATAAPLAAAAHAAGSDARDGLMGPIRQLPGLGKTWGANFTTQYAAGLRSRVDLVASAAGAISKALSNNLRASSPTKEGPLSLGGGIGVWGEKAGSLFAEGLYSRLPNLSSALGVMPAFPSTSALASRPGLGLGLINRANRTSGPTVQVVINGNVYGISGVDELTGLIAQRLRLQGA